MGRPCYCFPLQLLECWGANRNRFQSNVFLCLEHDQQYGRKLLNTSANSLSPVITAVFISDYVVGLSSRARKVLKVTWQLILENRRFIKKKKKE